MWGGTGGGLHGMKHSQGPEGRVEGVQELRVKKEEMNEKDEANENP